MKRRTFLQISGSFILGALWSQHSHSVRASQNRPKVVYGEEIPSRCPLCSLGCGTISFKDSRGRLRIEGDPDCPVARGSLCARGVAAVKVNEISAKQVPLYRRPGTSEWEEIKLEKAIGLAGRRIKDMRDQQMGSPVGKGLERNRFDSLGVLAGGNLTNEQAYLATKLFRSLGVVYLDTTVRVSRGMVALGLRDTLGLPGPTHSSIQVAQSDVVILLGSNPGLTSPALARALEDVRRRSGTVVIIDPRRTETVRPGDIWLNVRPGSDAAVLGAIASWIMEKGTLRIDELTRYTDASFMAITELDGDYLRHRSGKNKGRLIRDNTLTEPYSIFQRLKSHYSRYSLEKTADIAGVDLVLLRRVCKLLQRTGEQEFSACFVLGAGALAGTAGSEVVRLVATVQSLLGNLKKRGGGIVVAAGSGNAQGVCDMGLLAPFLPGYIPLPVVGKDPVKNADGKEEAEALVALARSWFDRDRGRDAVDLLPARHENEDLTTNGIIRAIVKNKIRALVVIGAEPLRSLPGGKHLMDALRNLDLLIVMDVDISRTAAFWKEVAGTWAGTKTEVIFIPTEPPFLREGSLTDGSRRVRALSPGEELPRDRASLLSVLSSLGTELKTLYNLERGSAAEPVKALNWTFNATVNKVGREINGFEARTSGEDKLLPPGNKWPPGAVCGNRLYRGWFTEEEWLPERRDPSDTYGTGLFEGWGWFWPWGVPDPFSHIYSDATDRTVLLRYEGQGRKKLDAAEALPLRPYLPVLFWKKLSKGSPFPEYYEPFHSPFPDYLTGGQADPLVTLRDSERSEWGYLFRRPERVLEKYPVILSLRRTGNVMGSGGVLAKVDLLTELGTTRFLEISPSFARELEAKDGTVVTIYSPDDKVGITATTIVTERIRDHHYSRGRFPVVSLTLYGDNDRATNNLMTAIYNTASGGMEMKAFLVKVVKKSS